MSDSNQQGSSSTNDNISDQLKELGKNLHQIVQSAWQSEERRKLQNEIEEGLKSMRESLNQAAQEFSSTPTGKTISDDVKDFQERWRSGEVQSKARSEIMDALRKVNDELQKAAQKNPPPPADKP
jgi:vacuolar-type H+-ATPase subunit E/Vma4